MGGASGGGGGALGDVRRGELTCEVGRKDMLPFLIFFVVACLPSARGHRMVLYAPESSLRRDEHSDYI